MKSWSCYRSLFLEKLEPEYDEYRISAIIVIGYFMILVAILESIIMTFQRDFFYTVISIPSIFIFFILLKYHRSKVHRLANAILIYFVLTGLRLAFTEIDNPAIYLFLPVTPLFLITLLGIRRGLNWITIYSILLIFFLAKYYFSYEEIPLNIEFLVCAVIASVYATHVTIGLENTIQSMLSKLKELANLDPLTQIYNRRKLNEFLDKEVERCKRYETQMSLLFLDIDFFKKINDTYGHDAGDLALKKIAEAIAKNLRSVDILARYGGEEFAILLPETSETNAMRVAEKIRQYIANMEIESIGTCTVSIGVSSLQISDSVDCLLKRADQALYLAKGKGRNRTELHRS